MAEKHPPGMPVGLLPAEAGPRNSCSLAAPGAWTKLQGLSLYLQPLLWEPWYSFKAWVARPWHYGHYGPLSKMREVKQGFSHRETSSNWLPGMSRPPTAKLTHWGHVWLRSQAAASPDLWKSRFPRSQQQPSQLLLSPQPLAPFKKCTISQCLELKSSLRVIPRVMPWLNTEWDRRPNWNSLPPRGTDA